MVYRNDDPPDYPEPSEDDLNRQENGRLLLDYYGAENWGRFYVQAYRDSTCGVTVGVVFHSHDRPVYCDDLYKYGPDDWPIEVHVSSIVEGVDQTTSTRIIKLDSPECLPAFDAALEAVDEEAGAIWDETHGCETCAKHWQQDPPDWEGWDDLRYAVGDTPIWAECPSCHGSGAVI